MGELIKKYGLNFAKYSSSSTTVSLLNHVGSTNKNYSYITKKGIFLHLFRIKNFQNSIMNISGINIQIYGY